jgi:hypothetical protein
MGELRKLRLYAGLACVVLMTALTASARADEIRLKDGKKLYGVIVAYEDNMFKVKTDFGYVLVEKDKIAQIIPSTPSDANAAKKSAAPSATPVTESQPPRAEPATTSPAETTAAAPVKRERAAIVGNPNARPEIPLSNVKNSDAKAPTIKPATSTAKTTLTSAGAPPPPPKEEPPANQEEIQGNLYINHTNGFRMYKAPSWKLIEDAGQALPNAIVAMGTTNESTLLVVGREKTKGTLDTAAPAVEKRMRDVYENYRLTSQRKTVVGGQQAIEYRYNGMADGHDWSGTLVVVGRGADIFTVLGMTYADTDLIQIQENVIARAIASVDFNVK